MLRTTALVLSLVVVVASLQLKDCSNNETNKAIEITQFEAPTHINFPGIVRYTLNMTFTRKICEVYVDFDITRHFLGFPLRLPCKAPTIVGTCSHIPMCDVLNRSANYMPGHIDSYGHKVQTIYNKTNGHYLTCPIQNENHYVKDAVLEMAEIPPYMHLLADGDYTIRVTARESLKGPVIGCIEVNATIGGRDVGGPSLIG